MKHYMCSVLIASLLTLFTTVLEAKPLELTAIQVVPIQDSATGRNYELYIKLPESYDAKGENAKNDRTYPVIYFTDALWHVELLSAATAFLMEDAILVGISWQKDNDEKLVKEVGEHVSRYRDYSVWQSSKADHQAKYQFGQASKHLTFIGKDVIRHVEKNYRTNPDNRTYFGYSMGGSFGAYILMAQPDTFKNYILGSPSVRRLSELEAIADTKPRSMNANVFISRGSQEEELGGHVDAFIASLKKRNDKTLTLKRVVPNGTHMTAFPATGVQSVTWLSKLQKEDK